MVAALRPQPTRKFGAADQRKYIGDGCGADVGGQPRDLVVSEEVGHHNLKPLCRYFGHQHKGMRIGREGVVPERFVTAVANRHLVTNWMAALIVPEIAANWIDDGTAAARLLDWQIAALGRRNRLAEKVLAGVEFRASPNGLHVWPPLPAPWTETEEALARGLDTVARLAPAVIPNRHCWRSDRVSQFGIEIDLSLASFHLPFY